MTVRTIGLLGGMSWESTAAYYRLINEAVRDRLGPLRSADLLIRSFDFASIAALQHAHQWDEAGRLLAGAAMALQDAGAQGILLCTNTMHRVADQIVERIDVPFLHIADCTAAAVRVAQVRSVALLGTRFTMEQDFYRKRLEAGGLDVHIPSPAARIEINRIIYEELCTGKLLDRSREICRAEIARLTSEGVEAIVLGCTELGLLIRSRHVSVPLFDTTDIHAAAAADFAMEQCEPWPRRPRLDLQAAI
jgi:aspartate racemase